MTKRLGIILKDSEYREIKRIAFQLLRTYAPHSMHQSTARNGSAHLRVMDAFLGAPGLWALARRNIRMRKVVRRAVRCEQRGIYFASRLDGRDFPSAQLVPKPSERFPPILWSWLAKEVRETSAADLGKERVPM